MVIITLTSVRIMSNISRGKEWLPIKKFYLILQYVKERIDCLWIDF
jgi:hypothetical protein